MSEYATEPLSTKSLTGHNVALPQSFDLLGCHMYIPPSGRIQRVVEIKGSVYMEVRESYSGGLEGVVERMTTLLKTGGPWQMTRESLMGYSIQCDTD